MSVEEESTSCYCLMDSTSCHLLLDQPGSYALVGEPLTQAAVKRLKLAVFGSMEADYMSYSLRVYCVDDTPHAFQVGGSSPVRCLTHCLIPSIAGFHSFSLSSSVAVKTTHTGSKTSVSRLRQYSYQQTFSFFQLIVLSLQPTPFCFTLTPLSRSVSSSTKLNICCRSTAHCLKSTRQRTDTVSW